MSNKPDSYAAIAFSLPVEFFPEDDDIARTAGLHIAKELGSFLENNGHTIPEWVRGGCEEDAWVYFESQRGDVGYSYDILFFPRSKNDTESMAVRYGLRVGLLRGLLGRYPPLPPDDPVHEEMKRFGVRFDGFEFLTGSEFDARY